LVSGDALYVTDFNLHVVFQVDVHFQRFFPLVTAGVLFRPSGLAVDDAGNLLVCDTRHNAIKIFRPDGQLLHQLDSIGSSRLNQPTDIALLKTGFLALLDLNGRVTVF